MGAMSVKSLSIAIAYLSMAHLPAPLYSIDGNFQLMEIFLTSMEYVTSHQLKIWPTVL